MANRIPAYFLAPSWDFPPPPSGPIRLGNIITSLKTPERPLHTAQMPADDDVFSSEQLEAVFSTEKLRAGRFEMLTKFMSVIAGIGIDAGVEWEKSDMSRFTFDRIETTQFIPKSSYLQACINAEPVQRYLAKSRYRKPVYVITGLKTVTGAKAESLRSAAVGGSVQAEVDALAWTGIPVGGGPGVGGRKVDRQSVAWTSGSDFVFAFRVRKVWAQKKMVTVKKEEDYKKGAMLDGAVEGVDGPGVSITAEEEADAEEGFLKEELMNGEEVVCYLKTELDHLNHQ